MSTFQRTIFSVFFYTSLAVCTFALDTEEHLADLQDAPEEAVDAFEQALRDLQAWADTKEDKYALLHARHLARSGYYASALK